jgi:hypothetical protein
VPWDDEFGDRAGRAAGAQRPGWLAYFDDATGARAAVLESLLDMPRSVRPAPATFPGWNLRLTLGQPDPICVVTPFPPLRRAVGLFDAGLPSLAVMEGESMHCFGDPACGERLSDLLSGRRPLDLRDLVVTAVPAGSAEPGSGSTLIRRPSFDLFVQEGSGPAPRS